MKAVATSSNKATNFAPCGRRTLVPRAVYGRCSAAGNLMGISQINCADDLAALGITVTRY